MKGINKYIHILFLIISYHSVICINPIIFSDKEIGKSIGKYIEILKDPTLKMEISDVEKSQDFKLSTQNTPVFGFTKATIWAKLQIKNNSRESHLLLELDAPLIDEAELFTKNEDGSFSSITIGQNKPFSTRKYQHTFYFYDLYINQGDTKTYYIKIKSFDQIEIPLKITTPLNAFSSSTTHNFIIGIYVGIMLIMIFYNLFIYFSVRDKSYLYYVIYIVSVLLVQTTFQGYTFKYIWPDNPKFEVQSILILSVIVGFTSVQFLRVFLNTAKFSPKLDKLFFIAFIFYFIATIFILLGLYQKSWQLILGIVSPLSLFMLFVGLKIARMGCRPAFFFTISWSIFLIGVFIYAMKDFGILPYSDFTVYTMPIGSAIETVLLSFALADKINILKKEKEASQASELKALKANEKLITDQNIILENKVEARTTELKHTNEELNNTLSHLKDTQTQLVSVEKMASLGQLTAGIAHEINNPINFVSANVKPLKMDFTDILELIKKYESITPETDLKTKLKDIENYKQQIDLTYLITEIESLLSGIDDGAKRTAEIVSGLKNFSRLDESDIKTVNINEGIQSTLILLKNAIPENTKVITDLGTIPNIECLPGKLNQVFMNILSNAIYAINKKKTDEDHKLIIKTYELNEHIYVSIEDTGIGMTDEVKTKVFDPFFTTKDVGEGTGLGMSIVFKIIESHHAKIEIESKYGVGTKILIILNKKININ